MPDSFNSTPEDRNTRDAALIRRIKADDSSALDELALLYAQKLADAAIQITYSPDLAQDSVQDTLIWLWDNRKQLNIKSSVLAYLVRAVRHRAQNIMRHEHAQHKLQNRVHAAHNYEEPSTNQESQINLAAADRDAEIHHALQELPPRTREIFLMRTDLELSYAEIAEATGIALKTVNAHIYRATRQLAHRLAPNKPR